MPAGAKYSYFERIKAAAQNTFLREWSIDQFLGSGSFGSVYRIVKRTGMGVSYSALKIIELNDRSIEKYKNEISALSSVANLSNSVKIEDYSEVTVDEDGFNRVFLVIRMELLEPLPKEGLSEAEVIKLGIQLCGTLAKCHDMRPRILHCDIKPDNILIGSDGNYRLGDFGEARLLDKSHASGSGNRGTPFFMSPEMHNYHGYDGRTDLYSLGISMYALLNGGNVPFFSGDMSKANEALRRRLDGEPLPPIPGVSERMMKIVCKLSAFLPEDRYQTALEARSDLKALYQQNMLEAKRAEETRRQKEQEEQRKQELRQREEQWHQAANNHRSAENDIVDSAVEGITSLLRKATLFIREKPIISAALMIVLAVLTGVILIVTSISSDDIAVENHNAESPLPSVTTESTPYSDAITTVKQDALTTETSRTEKPETLPSEATVSDNQVDSPTFTRSEVVNISDSMVKFELNYTDYTAIVVGCVRNAKDLIIPQYISDSSGNIYTVTEIGNHAFYKREFSSVSIPNSVTTIGDEAFMQCGYLTEIVVPNSVTKIGKSSFAWCDALTDVTLSSNLKTIANHAFCDCDAITNIVIPDSVTTIGDYAFSYCDKLHSITIPESVTDIGNWLFLASYELSEIHGKKGSEAERYAIEHNKEFIEMQ